MYGHGDHRKVCLFDEREFTLLLYHVFLESERLLHFISASCRVAVYLRQTHFMKGGQP